MRRRSFLAAASAAAGCAALGVKSVATPVKLLPSEYSAPYDVMWDGTKWIKDLFYKIELGMDKNLSTYTLMTSHNNLQFEARGNKTCIIRHRNYHHPHCIPLEAKGFDKSEFYAATIRQFKSYKIDFYEINYYVASGGEITIYSNLYATIGEILDGH